MVSKEDVCLLHVKGRGVAYFIMIQSRPWWKWSKLAPWMRKRKHRDCIDCSTFNSPLTLLQELSALAATLNHSWSVCRWRPPITSATSHQVSVTSPTGCDAVNVFCGCRTCVLGELVQTPGANVVDLQDRHREQSCQRYEGRWAALLWVWGLVGCHVLLEKLELSGNKATRLLTLDKVMQNHVSCDAFGSACR